MTLLYSPLNVPLGLGTAALRQRWSDLSSRKEVFDFEKNDARENPLFFLARIISSKSLTEGEDGAVLSRWDMNSLNASNC